MAYHCAVKGCGNGSYRLKKWKNEQKNNNSEPPFKLYPFPTLKKNPEKRKTWISNINRLEEGSKLKFFSPSKDIRVCSNHFKDGAPTSTNPNPTENLGYDFESKQRRRSQNLLSLPSPSPTGSRGKRRRISNINPTENSSTSADLTNASTIDSTHEEKISDDFCITPKKKETSKNLSFRGIELIDIPPTTTTTSPNKNKTLSFGKMNTINISPGKISCKRVILKSSSKTQIPQTMFGKLCTTNKKCNFYTNIPSRSLFEELHKLFKPMANKRYYGKTTKSPCKKGRKRALLSKDEMLLTLMKLKLGVPFEDLGDRFGIDKSTASRIFTCWIRLLSRCFESIIYLPDIEHIRATLPPHFSPFQKLVSIIDCSEVFIETPKDLELQSATWSDYKHHNTIKFLIATTPNSFINFVSEPYTGRISDKAITNECEFLDTIPAHSMIMADKGFNISNECAEHNIEFKIPPGKRGSSQMTPAEVKRTSEIAQVRILVEQVIRRVKTFRLLAGEVPISMLPHMRDALIVCCGISNLKVPIMSGKKKN